MNMDTKWSIDELQDIWQLASNLHDGQKYGGQEKVQKKLNISIILVV